MDIYCREFQGGKYKYVSSKKNLYNVVSQNSISEYHLEAAPPNTEITNINITKFLLVKIPVYNLFYGRP